jgi:hypothetical protein
MLDDCVSTPIPLSVAGSESIHTKRLLTGIFFFDFKNAGDHTPISPFTIMGKDFHLKYYESVYIRTSTAEIAPFCGPLLRYLSPLHWRHADYPAAIGSTTQSFGRASGSPQ